MRLPIVIESNQSFELKNPNAPCEASRISSYILQIFFSNAFTVVNIHFVVAVGGIMGFAKSGSSKSLMAGGGSASILYYVFLNLPSNPVLASTIGLGKLRPHATACGCLHADVFYNHLSLQALIILSSEDYQFWQFSHCQLSFLIVTKMHFSSLCATKTTIWEIEHLRIGRNGINILKLFESNPKLVL